MSSASLRGSEGAGPPGDHSMRDQGPGSWDGPIRGTPAWWRGLAPADGNATLDKELMTAKKHKRGIRKELVERVKRDIAAGVYDTPEKWEAALDKLLERMGE